MVRRGERSEVPLTTIAPAAMKARVTPLFVLRYLAHPSFAFGLASIVALFKRERRSLLSALGQ
jgi:hypothetical protein